MTVRRTVRYPRGTILDSTKGTYGDRIVPLTPAAKEIIEAAKEMQAEQGIDSNGYVFATTGEPINTYCAIQKAFTKYCKMLGITVRSPHKARKTYVSELIDGGININTVRSIAGHKDEQTTLRNYVYDRKSRAERNAQVVAAIQ